MKGTEMPSSTRTYRQSVTYRTEPGGPTRTVEVSIPAGDGHTREITDAVEAATGDVIAYTSIVTTGPVLVCEYCGERVRGEGLQVVSNADDSPACPDAPLRGCGSCRGDGCGSCEGYGEVFGPHVVTVGA